jgi:flagellar basal body-associated protein FliL
MENRIKKSQLAISLLWVTVTFAVAGFGAAALLSITQVSSANASTIPTGPTEMNERIQSDNTNKNNTIILAEKPFLVEHGKTVAATPINQTHRNICHKDKI